MSNLLGCHPPLATCSVTPFQEGVGLVPKDQWRPISLRHLKAPVISQNGYNACVGFAAATCFKRAWQLSGQPYRDFSSFWIYGLINGGRDQGAQLEDAVDVLEKIGVPTTAECPDKLYFPSTIPSNLRPLAAKSKALDVYWITKFEELCSALTLGFDCISGTAVDQRFQRGLLGPNGLAYATDLNSIVGYHALEHHGLEQQPNGEWVIPTQNSWGNWGLNGYCLLTSAHFTRSRFTAFAIRAAQDDSQETATDPPVVLS